MLLLASCTSVIKCPNVENEDKAVLVSVVDHGKHATLMIQDTIDTIVRYAYGDWKYYALSEQSLWSGSAALFWPTQATLGRKQLMGKLGSEMLKEKLVVFIEDYHFFKVEDAKARNLIHSLDKVYQDNIHTKNYNSLYDLHFVHYPANYSVFANSNYMVSRWMEALGCKVDGLSVLSKWQKSLL